MPNNCRESREVPFNAKRKPEVATSKEVDDLFRLLPQQRSLPYQQQAEPFSKSPGWRRPVDETPRVDVRVLANELREVEKELVATRKQMALRDRLLTGFCKLYAG